MPSGNAYRYVFGPVPSRRLGLSLGVDLVPFKHCPFDCVYCQLGATTDKTVERREFVPFDAVVDEVTRKVVDGVRPDYVTLSGSGEPTLYSRLGELITALKTATPVPVALITNASLFGDPAVRAEAALADLVVPSLDAGGPAWFQSINRPHPDLSYEAMVEGLVAFRETYTGPLWLEVFVLADTPGAELEAMAGHAARIRPDRIQINTVVRPPTEATAQPAPKERLEAFAQRLGPHAEVIADFSRAAAQQRAGIDSGEILAMIRRRPCSLNDIAESQAIHANEAVKHLEELLKDGRIRAERRGETTYYVAE